MQPKLNDSDTEFIPKQWQSQAGISTECLAPTEE